MILVKVITQPLPEGSIVRLYQVEDYYVQIGFVETLRFDAEGTRSRGIAFSACTCPEGFTNIALSLCGQRPRCCMHVDAAVAHAQQETLNAVV